MASFWVVCLFGIVFSLCASTSKAAILTNEETYDNITTVTDVTSVTVTSFETTTANVTSDNTTYPEYVGFITAGVAVVFFGSNFVPVKKFETGDGMFFQWMLCAGIWLTGLVVQIVRQSVFYPYVMVGGAIWATGNICVVPIIKTIGMGLGLCIWGMFNLLSGWASGRFGWFGIDPEVPNHLVLNYVGVALAVASSVIYVFVKIDITPPPVEIQVQTNSDDDEPLLGHRQDLYGAHPQDDALIFNKRTSSSTNSNLTDQNDDTLFFERLQPGYKRILGVVLSVISGFLYGINFAPAIHVQDRVHGASQNSLDYIFAQYCGIFLTSSVYFLLYAVVKRNKPRVYPRVILPAIASGVMWAIATGCWFEANKALSEPVAFPIITTGPGALASLFWGVCIFKEIKGRRNILILLLAFVITMSGAVLAGISKG
ncbi:hypothetical protein ACOMHN_045309 [Nucella lapillus]